MLDYTNDVRKQEDLARKMKFSGMDKEWKYFGLGVDKDGRKFQWRTNSQSHYYGFKKGKKWYGKMTSSNINSRSCKI